MIESKNVFPYDIVTSSTCCHFILSHAGKAFSNLLEHWFLCVWILEINGLAKVYLIKCQIMKEYIFNYPSNYDKSISGYTRLMTIDYIFIKIMSEYLVYYFIIYIPIHKNFIFILVRKTGTLYLLVLGK